LKRLGYVESTLAPGEQIRYQARYHWWHYRVALLLLVIAALVGGASALYVGRPPNGGNAAAIGRFALIFAAIAGFVFVLRYVQARAVEMVVTSARAIRKRGIFRREVAQTALRQVRDVSLRRGLAGRFLGFGTVSFETGTETRPLRFPDVCDPEAVRSAAVAPEETSAAESRSSS
jgi:ABC-type multidrug transport system fused ATPase/permease subunit